MAGHFVFQLVNGLGVICSIAWLVTSVIFLNLAYSTTTSGIDLGWFGYVLVLSSVLLSFFQFLLTLCFIKPLRNEWRAWYCFHLLVFILSIPQAIPAYGHVKVHPEAQAYVGFCSLETLFGLIASVLICYMGDSSVDDEYVL